MLRSNRLSADIFAAKQKGTQAERRWTIVTEWKRHPTLKIANIARLVHVHHSTAKRWISVYTDQGHVNDAHISGRPSSTTPAMMAELQRSVLDKKQKGAFSAASLGKHLHMKFGRCPSASTVRRTKGVQ